MSSPVSAHNYLRGSYNEESAKLISVVPDNITREYSH